jgi:hypothetical protein
MIALSSSSLDVRASAYEAGGQTYIVSANEGDACDRDGYSEETLIGASTARSCTDMPA